MNRIVSLGNSDKRSREKIVAAVTKNAELAELLDQMKIAYISRRLSKKEYSMLKGHLLGSLSKSEKELKQIIDSVESEFLIILKGRETYMDEMISTRGSPLCVFCTKCDSLQPADWMTRCNICNSIPRFAVAPKGDPSFHSLPGQLIPTKP